MTNQLNQYFLSHFDTTRLKVLSNQFNRDGFIKISDVVPAEVKALIHEEAYRLLAFSERRDITLATTDHTPRKLSIVHSDMVMSHGQHILELSEDASLLDFLALITGEKLYKNIKSDERFVITKQTQIGDTHGWHWGDYAFALIWLIEVPPIEHGGMLQCIPHTRWDKSNPRINEYLVNNPINTYGFEKGDVYLLRTDTTLHRTVPLSQNSTRIMLNMSWGAKSDQGKESLDVDDRWWSQPEAHYVRHTHVA